MVGQDEIKFCIATWQDKVALQPCPLYHRAAKMEPRSYRREIISVRGGRPCGNTMMLSQKCHATLVLQHTHTCCFFGISDSVSENKRPCSVWLLFPFSLTDCIRRRTFWSVASSVRDANDANYLQKLVIWWSRLNAPFYYYLYRRIVNPIYSRKTKQSILNILRKMSYVLLEVCIQIKIFEELIIRWVKLPHHRTS